MTGVVWVAVVVGEMRWEALGCVAMDMVGVLLLWRCDGWCDCCLGDGMSNGGLLLLPWI